MTAGRSRSSLHARSRLWVDMGEAPFLGPGRTRLLEAVAAAGSISAAARDLGMSYRKAWNLIDSINRAASRPLVESTTGGRGGGGATLTPDGERAIAIYRELEMEVEQICRRAERRFASLWKAPRRGRSSDRDDRR